MTHRERIEALLAGEQPDRMPVSFWRHFYDQESSADDLSRAMLKFQDKFDWDLMKINPRASYHLEDWGNKYTYTNDPMEKPIHDAYAVNTPADWEKIGILNPDKAPVLVEHVDAVAKIVNASSDDLPIVMTVFNPISIAGDLVENDQFLVDQIHENPEAVKQALKNITMTFIEYCKRILAKGVDGIFFATTQWASTNLLTEDEYKIFGREFDMMLLEEIIPLTKLNVLHVCSSNNMLGFFKDYPFKLINWDITDPTNASAEQGAEILTNKVVMGGVDRKGLLQTGSPAELKAMVDKYFKFAKKHPFMLAPDCSVPVSTPDDNLNIIKTKIEQSANF